MKNSTKHALRTAFQTVVGLLVSAPLLLANVPDAGKASAIVAAVGLVSKVINALEDHGIIPAWLYTKSDSSDPSDTASAA